MKSFETTTSYNRYRKDKLRILFKCAWRGYGPGSWFDTQNFDDVSIPNDGSGEIWVAGLGLVPKEVIEDILEIEQSTIIEETVEITVLRSYSEGKF